MQTLTRVLWELRAMIQGPGGRARLFRKYGAFIGEGTRLFVRGLGSEPYLVSIEDEVTVSGEVLFLTHDGASWSMRDVLPNVNRFGRITVRRRAFIGARAILMPGVTIGERAIVGAGAVVTKDVPAGMVVAGVPARVLCTTQQYIERASARSVALPARDSEGNREALLGYFPPTA
jgi:acetyltransferase-like isoleucine patch superfamily enzyme